MGGEAAGRRTLLLGQTLKKSPDTFSSQSFARNAMTGKAKVRHGDGEGVGEAKAEREDEAMDYLLKPSPMIVRG